MTRSTITLHDQRRTGLSREHSGLRQSPHERVRLTIPAREALARAGAIITPEPIDAVIGLPTYTVELRARVPAHLIAAHTRAAHPGGGWVEVLSLRMDTEAEYPGEFLGDYWKRLDFSPCPRCGAPLVWYEAGYVPGYRVCAGRAHHHFQAR